jgi:radical SAM protein with 4Fe4S-binding SPASM domain
MWFCGPEFEYDVRDWGFFCPAGINAMAILSNGDINGCPLIDGMVEGNVKQDNVMAVWENGFKNYRDVSWKKVGKCKDCQWFDFCSGDGLHLWQGDKMKLKKCYYMLIKEGYEKIHQK